MRSVVALLCLHLALVPAQAGDDSPRSGGGGVTVDERTLPDRSVEVRVESHGSRYFMIERKHADMVRARHGEQPVPLARWRLLEFGGAE